MSRLEPVNAPLQFLPQEACVSTPVPQPFVPQTSPSFACERDGVHPALRAWRQLHAGAAEPTRIDTLKRKHKSAIYRLHGAGPKGVPVIAKCCLKTGARAERTIYEEVLPNLPLPMLRFYGWVEDDSPDFEWLFIEDAEGELYSQAAPGHRIAAVRWLASFHTSAARLPVSTRLPDRGPSFYLEQLRLARRNIVDNILNPALRPSDLEVLGAILTQCDFLEQRWKRLEQLCEGVPPTVVHGDLKEKNFRVRPSSQGTVLLAFDWELAGWGVPATDVFRCPDFGLYRLEAGKVWPHLTSAIVRKVASVGRIFRALIAIQWKSLALGSEWVEWPVDKLRLYRDTLDEAMQALGIH